MSNQDNTMWPFQRAKQLTQQIRKLRSKKIRFTFAPSIETDSINYFPENLASDLSGILPEQFEYVPPKKGITELDVVIITSHGLNLGKGIWSLRERLPTETIVAIWLWDNHLKPLNNYVNALGGDLIFPSHNYASDYLQNPASLLSIHVPACSVQWTRQEAADIFMKNIGRPRKDRLLVNYVDYSFSWRSKLLRELQEHVADADAFLMDPADRSRYFSKNRRERMEEWLSYKLTLILPLEGDLSTRVFDALLAGLVLLVPMNIHDFDDVIPQHLQEELCIIRLADLKIETIRDAIVQGIQLFDSKGESGVRARHQFVLENHMLQDRVGTILSSIRDIANGNHGVIFTNENQIQPSLQLG